ncbi:hypothetical protein OHV13_33685 [Kitasatospora purpeofusca]|uniref:hypothetical protein n=1 Tax=Kitasatospora purpeofusca TaxID=67352 RepID=UPI00324E3ACF
MVTLRMKKITTTIALLLGVGSAMMTSPASAAERWDTYSADRSTIGPGETLTITMTLTNTETTDISFAYEYVDPLWPLNTTTGVIAITGCGGDIVDCTVSGLTATYHPRVPISPGDSRSVTLTVLVLPPASPTPGSTMVTGWNPYMYYEYDRSPSGSFLFRHAGPFNPAALQGRILY